MRRLLIVKIENGINMIVYKPNPVTGDSFSGDKCPGLDPDIQLYKVKEKYKSYKENHRKSLSMLTQALRGLSKTYRRSYIPLSGCLTMREPLW